MLKKEQRSSSRRRHQSGLCLASTAQHSTAQHSTAQQHSTAAQVQSQAIYIDKDAESQMGLDRYARAPPLPGLGRQ